MQDNWLDKYKLNSNYIPGQMEIEYFFPLTEQIPLELDFSGCGVKKSIVAPTITSTGNIALGSTIAPSWTTTTIFNGSVETSDLVMKLDKRPNIMIKFLYKLLNIKWKLK